MMEEGEIMILEQMEYMDNGLLDYERKALKKAIEELKQKGEL